MYSQPNEFQMPRTIPNYQLHQQHLFQHQLQVFQQQFQAFQHQQQQPHPHPHQQQAPLLNNNLHTQDHFAPSTNCVDTPPSSSVSPAGTDEPIETGYQRGVVKTNEDIPRQYHHYEAAAAALAEDDTEDEEEDATAAVAQRRRRDTGSTSSGARRSSNRGKSKRVRTIFTPEQLKRLEQEFSNQMYLVGHDRGFLASSLSLTEAQVKVWFQNRRIKFRKLNQGSSSPSSNNHTDNDQSPNRDIDDMKEEI